MKGFSASLDRRGNTRIEIIKSVPENIQLSKDLSHQIPLCGTLSPVHWHPGYHAQCFVIKSCPWGNSLVGAVAGQGGGEAGGGVKVEISRTVVSNSSKPHGLYSPPGSSVHRDSPGKNIGMGCHALLLLGSSQPRDGTQVSRIAGGFFTFQATREVPFANKIIYYYPLLIQNLK